MLGSRSLPPRQSLLSFICLFLALGVAGSVTHRAATTLYRLHVSAPEIEREPLYLPSGEYLRVLTLGFHNVAAHTLWFSTINYFGKEFASQGDFRWLGHMCDLVTTLDPRALHAYEFCGSLLSWVAKEPASAQELLQRGITAYPEHWKLRYLYGFNSWYFLDDLTAAEEAFVAAAQLPQAPAFVGTLASRIMVNRSDPTAAVAFLKDLIAQTPNASAKKALKKKLRLARVSRHLYLLTSAAQRFHARHGRFPTTQDELVFAGLLESPFSDPFRGEYRISPEDGSAYTTSGVKGLLFQAKTAKTGALRHEFQDLP